MSENKIDDGGPAFPSGSESHGYRAGNLTVRDCFIIACILKGYGSGSVRSADSMMRARAAATAQHEDRGS